MQTRVKNDGKACDGPNPAQHGEDQRENLIAARHKIDADATYLPNAEAPGADKQRPEIQSGVFLECGIDLKGEIQGYPHRNRAEGRDQAVDGRVPRKW